MEVNAHLLVSNQYVSVLLDGMAIVVNRRTILVQEGNVTDGEDAEHQSELASVNATRDGRATSVTRELTCVNR